MVASLPDLGLGLAIKTDDGANRAAEVSMSALMRRFGGDTLARDSEDRTMLDNSCVQVLSNWRGTRVGEIRSAIRVDGALA